MPRGVKSNFISEIVDTYNRYDGRHLYVRYRNWDTSTHKARGKIISLPRNGYPGQIEVVPLSGHHKKPEWVDVEKNHMSWWTAECQKHHPDWLRRKPISKAKMAGYHPDTTFHLMDVDGNLWTGLNDFKPTLINAKTYASHDRATAAMTRVGKHTPCKIITHDGAFTLAQKNGWALEIAKRESVLAAVPVKQELLSPISELRAAWQLFTEAGNKLLGMLDKIENGEITHGIQKDHP